MELQDKYIRLSSEDFPELHNIRLKLNQRYAVQGLTSFLLNLIQQTFLLKEYQ